jgi:hypothetical protein
MKELTHNLIVTDLLIPILKFRNWYKRIKISVLECIVTSTSLLLAEDSATLVQRFHHNLNLRVDLP